jgi:hypothetical protein
MSGTIGEELEIDEDKLTDYLSFNMSLVDLLELWEKLGGISGIYSPDEMGVADFLVREYGSEKICNLFAADLIPELVGDDEDLRKEARRRMREMGFKLKRRLL